MSEDSLGSEPVPDRILNEFGPGADTELLHHPLLVVFHRLLREIEVRGDFLRDPARRQLTQDLPLARCQLDLTLLTRAAPVPVRGRGDIFYDGRLDIPVDAGKVEKAQGLVGPAGDIFGLLTDRLLHFRVT